MRKNRSLFIDVANKDSHHGKILGGLSGRYEHRKWVSVLGR